MTNDSELENLQCFPFHLPGTLRAVAVVPPAKSESYTPLGKEARDCRYLSSIAEEPCWGPVEMDYHLTILGSFIPLYHCQGHKRGGGKYDFEPSASPR